MCIVEISLWFPNDLTDDEFCCISYNKINIKLINCTLINQSNTDYRYRNGFPIWRGSRMRKLRRDIDAALAERWHRSLSLQCMRTLS